MNDGRSGYRAERERLTCEIPLGSATPCDDAEATRGDAPWEWATLGADRRRSRV